MLTGTHVVNVAIGSLLSLVLFVRAAPADIEPQTLRLGPALDSLAVLHDGAGHYVALEDGGSSSVFYYGDGITFYKQHVSLFSDDLDTKAFVFWAPNVFTAGRAGGRLNQSKEGRWTVACNGNETELEVLEGSALKDLVTKAVFKAARAKREVRFAARDEEGQYYVVDSERDGYGPNWRLFVGKRGKMSEFRLLDVVSDSGGDVFATDKGDLSFERRDHKRIAIWSKGQRSEELTFVPPELNARLFYVEIGLYGGGLGTPCDHF